MSKETINKDYSLLLGLIPSHLRKPEQVSRWRSTRESTTYELLRDPLHLDELNAYKHSMAIWRDNGTLTYFAPKSDYDYPQGNERYLSLVLGKERPRLHITGRTDEAVVQTATFFMALEKTTPAKSTALVIGTQGQAFDFQTAGAGCLHQICKVNPYTYIKCQGLTLSAEQSVVLATRNHCNELRFHACRFVDGGTAFIDALKNRGSSLHLLQFAENAALDDDNVKRLVQLDNIEHLMLPRLSDEIKFLPFAAPVDYLYYELAASSILKDNDLFSWNNIVTNKLSVTFYHASEGFPIEGMIAFFRRLAHMSHHLVQLTIQVRFKSDYSAHRGPISDCVVDEIIRAVLANDHLEYLDVSDSDRLWEPHVERLFKGIQDHKGLCTLKMYVFDEEAFGPNCSHLRELLSRNRKIKVVDQMGLVYKNGFFRSSVRELYMLNRFYCGSGSLVQVPPSDRSMLVATALMQSAARDFQRSALLMSNHIDALCELVQCAGLDTETDADTSAAQVVQRNKTTKRRRCIE